MNRPPTATCPGCGTESTSADYCDSCGAIMASPATAPPCHPITGPLPAWATSTTAGAVPGSTCCPSCGALGTAGDVFCEVCGIDLVTGELPPLPPHPEAEDPPSDPDGLKEDAWTAVIEADPAFFDTNRADTIGALRFPEGLSPREVPLTGDEMVVGRSKDARGTFPGIDLSEPVPDPGVSRRHAILRRQPDGSWALIDQGSANGTWLNGAGLPVEAGAVTRLKDGDSVHLGAFTLVRIRRDSGGAS